MGVSDREKGWVGLQDGPYHSNTKLNFPTNIILDVLDGCRPYQSKTACPPIENNHPPAHINPSDTIVVDSGTSGIYFISTDPVDNLNS